MSRRQREKMFSSLSHCCDFGEGWVSAVEIDRRGLPVAMQLGVARALKSLGASPLEKIIIDGPINYLPKFYKSFECLINADDLVPLVSAASVYAKVKRDLYMIELAKLHEGYGFENHVGYLTAGHKLALKNSGPLKSIHRMSFRPLKATG